MCHRCELRKDGRQARLLGIELSACPYTIGSVCAQEWTTGWIQEDTEFEEVSLALVRQSGREGRIAR